MVNFIPICAHWQSRWWCWSVAAKMRTYILDRITNEINPIYSSNFLSDSPHYFLFCLDPPPSCSGIHSMGVSKTANCSVYVCEQILIQWENDKYFVILFCISREYYLIHCIVIKLFACRFYYGCLMVVVFTITFFSWHFTFL